MKNDRLQSLDAFRGFTIAAMILVNGPGSWDFVYPQLEHAAWNGWTFADWVFPFFLWIMGVAMTFSLGSKRAKETPLGALLPGILRRAALLFLLGLVYNTFPFGLLPGQNLHWATFRIPGVLQRIAFCYAAGSLVYLTTGFRGRVAAILGCFGLYGVAMHLVPVPGVGAGVLEPGRNFAHHLDAMLLHGHAWSFTAPWDPEGLFGSIPALASTLLGTLTGDYLRRQDHAPMEKSCWMALGGGALLILGKALSPWSPINKTLWSPSYAIFMAGWAMVIFSAFHFLVDVKGRRAWAKPLVIYGSNAILVYMLSCALTRFAELIKFTTAAGPVSAGDLVFRALCHLASPLNASALYAVGNVAILFLPVWYLFRKGWFLKV